jgi:hypothetical protein
MTEPVRPTRRELFRMFATVGAITASATLLDACGASPQGPAEASAQTPTHPGALIMIIRHGEKPDGSGSPQGIDPDGKQDSHALTPRG